MSESLHGGGEEMQMGQEVKGKKKETPKRPGSTSFEVDGVEYRFLVQRSHEREGRVLSVWIDGPGESYEVEPSGTKARVDRGDENMGLPFEGSDQRDQVEKKDFPEWVKRGLALAEI